MHCPTCEREFDPKTSAALPFCSERCRLIDLGRWLDEAHSVPAMPDPEDFVDEVPPPEST
ncbi:MAG: DNA gyrase inhibitor YacG [Pirellulales bacterium]